MLMREDIYNDLPMLLLCSAGMLIVLFQTLFFLKMSWKHGRELGIEEKNMRGTAKSSAIFSILPTLPVLISYLVLVPAFGKYFAWLRLSIMGNAAYETTIADMVTTSLGYSDIYAEGIDINSFVTMMFVITFAIMGGAICTLFFTKFYEKKVRQATTNLGGGKMVGLITTAMFVGLYSSLAANKVVNFNQPLNLAAFIVAILVTILCTKLSEKYKPLKQFTFSISIVMGMLSASVLTVLL